MKKKMSGVLIAAFLVTALAQAQRDYRVVPSPWAFSWGVGWGTMVPSGSLGAHFQAGFAADTEITLYYQKAFLIFNGYRAPGRHTIRSSCCS